MSSSTKIDDRKKDILILGKGPTQGLEHTLYSINFTEKNKNSVSVSIITKKRVICQGPNLETKIASQKKKRG